MPGLRMTTRPSNKDKHPGQILLGSPCRTSEEMDQLCKEAAARAEAEEKRLTAAIEKVAQIEDTLRDKDNEQELERRQRREQLRAENPSVVTKKGKENKGGGMSGIASKKPQRAAAAKNKGKTAVEDSEEESGVSDADPEFKAASDASGDESSGDDTGSESGDSHDASEVVTKKRKRSKPGKKKNVKKGRKDVKVMRKNLPPASSATSLNAKHKAVPDKTGPKVVDTPVFDPEWAKKHATSKESKGTKCAAPVSMQDNDSCVGYGRFAGNNEDDTVEASTVRKSVLKPGKAAKDLYPSIHIQNTSTDTPKTMKEDEVIPRTRQLLGTLEPWTLLTPELVQPILDEVFGKRMYTAARNEVFFNLAKMRMENWCHNFSQAGIDAVKSLLINNEVETPAAVKELIGEYLSKVPIAPKSEFDTYAFHWANWKEDGAIKTGFCQNNLILHTFAHAHLAHIKLEGVESFGEEKPIGALLMAMQAVGRALEMWSDGTKSTAKPLPFSGDNYSDIYIKINNQSNKRRRLRRATIFVSTLKNIDKDTWDIILKLAHEYIETGTRRRGSSASASSNSALVTGTQAEEIEDPDADFVMAI
ncbi:hypothetical protein M378DRAFT_18705 [Amanita muscaria Koide BX008]|uniref:DUF6532 domain-containing protein n=1 Tax=Amanita muscaria (strain Koide BX008) TaxID=946122 RepID=A0A0C2RWI4_AMAMK|nr:hypothetical protein M378DRAFT_18705 [Amanita muscaria Koide BX008]